MSSARSTWVELVSLVMIGSIAMVLGCERGRGVIREASLVAAPNWQCVENAIRSTPGVLSVSRRSHRSGDADWHSYLYRGEATVVQMTVTNEDGKTRYRQSSLQYGKSKISLDEVTEAIALMKAAELRLHEDCAVVIEGEVKQRCVGVRCP